MIKSLKEILSSFHFNLFCVHLIHRGCDPSDMELVKYSYDLNHLFYKISITSMVWYIILGGGLGNELNIRILRIQRRVIRSMVGVSSRTSCRQLFNELNIITLASLFILEVIAL